MVAARRLRWLALAVAAVAVMALSSTVWMATRGNDHSVGGEGVLEHMKRLRRAGSSAAAATRGHASRRAVTAASDELNAAEASAAIGSTGSSEGDVDDSDVRLRGLDAPKNVPLRVVEPEGWENASNVKRRRYPPPAYPARRFPFDWAANRAPSRLAVDPFLACHRHRVQPPPASSSVLRGSLTGAQCWSTSDGRAMPSSPEFALSFFRTLQPEVDDCAYHAVYNFTEYDPWRVLMIWTPGRFMPPQPPGRKANGGVMEAPTKGPDAASYVARYNASLAVPLVPSNSGAASHPMIIRASDFVLEHPVDANLSDADSTKGVKRPRPLGPQDQTGVRGLLSAHKTHAMAMLLHRNAVAVCLRERLHLHTIRCRPTFTAAQSSASSSHVAAAGALPPMLLHYCPCRHCDVPMIKARSASSTEDAAAAQALPLAMVQLLAATGSLDQACAPLRLRVTAAPFLSWKQRGASFRQGRGASPLFLPASSLSERITDRQQRSFLNLATRCFDIHRRPSSHPVGAASSTWNATRQPTSSSSSSWSAAVRPRTLRIPPDRPLIPYKPPTCVVVEAAPWLFVTNPPGTTGISSDQRDGGGGGKRGAPPLARLPYEGLEHNLDALLRVQADHNAIVLVTIFNRYWIDHLHNFYYSMVSRGQLRNMIIATMDPASLKACVRNRLPCLDATVLAEQDASVEDDDDDDAGGTGQHDDADPDGGTASRGDPSSAPYAGGQETDDGQQASASVGAKTRTNAAAVAKAGIGGVSVALSGATRKVTEAMSWIKPRLAVAILARNYGFFMVDLDMSWNRFPMHEVLAARVDLAHQCDAELKTSINSGFYFARPTWSTIRFFENLMVIPPEENSDQTAMKLFSRYDHTHGVSHACLPRASFNMKCYYKVDKSVQRTPIGGGSVETFQWRPVETNRQKFQWRILHATCISGALKKMAWLRTVNAWFLDDLDGLTGHPSSSSPPSQGAPVVVAVPLDEGNIIQRLLNAAVKEEDAARVDHRQPEASSRSTVVIATNRTARWRWMSRKEEDEDAAAHQHTSFGSSPKARSAEEEKESVLLVPAPYAYESISDLIASMAHAVTTRPTSPDRPTGAVLPSGQLTDPWVARHVAVLQHVSALPGLRPFCAEFANGSSWIKMGAAFSWTVHSPAYNRGVDKTFLRPRH